MLRYLDSKDLLPHRHALLTLAPFFFQELSQSVSQQTPLLLSRAQAGEQDRVPALRERLRLARGTNSKHRAEKQVRELQGHEEEETGCFTYGAVTAISEEEPSELPAGKKVERKLF